MRPILKLDQPPLKRREGASASQNVPLAIVTTMRAICLRKIGRRSFDRVEFHYSKPIVE